NEQQIVHSQGPPCPTPRGNLPATTFESKPVQSGDPRPPVRLFGLGPSRGTPRPNNAPAALSVGTWVQLQNWHEYQCNQCILAEGVSAAGVVISNTYTRSLQTSHKPSHNTI